MKWKRHYARPTCRLVGSSQDSLVFPADSRCSDNEKRVPQRFFLSQAKDSSSTSILHGYKNYHAEEVLTIRGINSQHSRPIARLDHAQFDFMPKHAT